MLKSWKVVGILGAILIGCDASNSERNAPVPIAKATPLGATDNAETRAPRSGEPTERLIGGMKFEIPPDWEEKTLSNTMILAEFTLPGKAGPGRLTLSTAGGGTTANMDRWKDQFRRSSDDPEPKESIITVAGKDATMIDLHGAFADTTMGAAPGGGLKSNWQLLGVAIPIDSDHNYFVKLTGPSETVSARHEEFLKFIQSARFD